MGIPGGTLLLLLLLLLLTITAEARRRSRIWGGSVIQPHSVPSLVVFMREGKVVFSGNLIGPRTVLTAGHNLQNIVDGDSKENYIVLIGAHDVTATYGPEYQYKISSFERVKNSKTLDPPDDLAVVTLDRSVELAKLGPRARIGHLTALDPGDLNGCFIAGWGIPNKGNPLPSPVPKKASVQLITPQTACGQAVKDITGKPELLIKPKQYGYRYDSLCFSGINGNQCLGDSGGPVLCVHPDTNEIVQTGVISTTFSSDSSCGERLSVASSASAHIMWINSRIQK